MTFFEIYFDRRQQAVVSTMMDATTALIHPPRAIAHLFVFIPQLSRSMCDTSAQECSLRNRITNVCAVHEPVTIRSIRTESSANFPASRFYPDSATSSSETTSSLSVTPRPGPSGTVMKPLSAWTRSWQLHPAPNPAEEFQLPSHHYQITRMELMGTSQHQSMEELLQKLMVITNGLLPTCPTTMWTLLQLEMLLLLI